MNFTKFISRPHQHNQSSLTSLVLKFIFAFWAEAVGRGGGHHKLLTYSIGLVKFQTDSIYFVRMVSQRAWRCRALLQPPLLSHENWLINQACLLWFTSLLTLPPSKNERRCICTVLRHVEHDVPVIITQLSVDFVWWTRRSDLHTENVM